MYIPSPFLARETMNPDGINISCASWTVSNKDMTPTNIKSRQRALFSCDRCKKRKRACKRYNENGERVFDNHTPCEQCKASHVVCETKIIRKKRTFFSVSESSLLQLKSLTKIVKAMFPECDPDNFEDLKRIGKLLYVDLPETDPEISHDFKEDAISENEEIPSTGIDSTSTNIEESSEEVDSSLISARTYNNIIKIAEHLKELIKSSNVNGLCCSNEGTNPELQERLLGLAGAERLFTSLLEIDRKRSSSWFPSVEFNNSLTSVRSQRRSDTFKPCYEINGVKIQEFLILDLIPRDEMIKYFHCFFTRVHPNYLILREKVFNSKMEVFFKILDAGKDKYAENMKNYDFTNEDICILYLVLILGRASYLFELQFDETYKDPIQPSINEKFTLNNLVSREVIQNYVNVTNLCISTFYFSNSIASVKLLYLSSLYHASLKNRNAVWQLIGDSCMKCYTLGFHREKVVRQFDQREQDDIKIAFWACFRFHIIDCVISGRLPSVSLYEADVKMPDLKDIDDELFKESYRASNNLVMLMFEILKNREHLIKTRNPWSESNFVQVLKIKNKLIELYEGLSDDMKNYDRPDPNRYQIKMILQLHHSMIALTVPYLIAYALKPKKSIENNPEVLKTLSHGIKTATKIIPIIKFSSEQRKFNRLLFYDIFYAYHTLLMLLLCLTLIKPKLSNQENEYQPFANVLSREYGIDQNVILNAIDDIRVLNENYVSPDDTSVMKDASTNITFLLKHFRLDNRSCKSPTLSISQGLVSNCCSISNPLTPGLSETIPNISNLNNQDNMDFNFTPPIMNEMYSNSDAGFFNIVDQMKMDTDTLKPIETNEHFFWQWNNVFQDENNTDSNRTPSTDRLP